MDTINQVVLKDENIYPDDEVLQSVLGKSFQVYQELINLYDSHDLNCAWRYYHDGKAWLCKVQKKKRTIVWMSAWTGFMQATVYYPLRLIDNVLALDISDASKEMILNTKNVGKSKPCTFEMRESGILYQLVDLHYVDHIGIIMGALLGFGFGIIELFLLSGLRKKFLKLPLILTIFIKAITYLMIIYFFSGLVGLILGLTQGREIEEFYSSL